MNNHVRRDAVIDMSKTTAGDNHNGNYKNGVPVVRQGDIEAETARLTGVPRDTVKAVFNTFWDNICKELEAGHCVQLHGKGKFYLSERAARVGRNPLTGDEYDVPAREAMAFQTSPAYAKRLREMRAVPRE